MNDDPLDGLLGCLAVVVMCIMAPFAAVLVAIELLKAILQWLAQVWPYLVVGVGGLLVVCVAVPLLVGAVINQLRLQTIRRHNQKTLLLGVEMHQDVLKQIDDVVQEHRRPVVEGELFPNE